MEGALCLERGSYAAAYGVDVLHHMEDPVSVLRELRDALRPDAPIVFLEANPRFPITTMIGLLQKEERNVLKIGFRNLRCWFESAGFEVRSGVVRASSIRLPGPPCSRPDARPDRRGTGADTVLQLRSRSSWTSHVGVRPADPVSRA